MNECLAEKQPVLDINMCIVFMMMFFELFLLRKISERRLYFDVGSTFSLLSASEVKVYVLMRVMCYSGN